MFKIIYSKKALKFLQKQDKTTQQRIVTAISKLPLLGDIKNYKGLMVTDFELEISAYYLTCRESLLILSK